MTESRDPAIEPRNPAGADTNDLLKFLGEITALLSSSPAHRELRLSDLEWRIVPALTSGQFRLVRKAGLPVGFFSWAIVTEAIEERLRKIESFRLSPYEWACGHRPILIDFVSVQNEVEATMQLARATIQAVTQSLQNKTTCSTSSTQGSVNSVVRS